MSLPTFLSREAAFARFFEGSPCLGLVFDAHGRLVSANRAARRFCADSPVALDQRTDLYAPFFADRGTSPQRSDWVKAFRADTLCRQADSDWVNGKGEKRRLRWTHEIIADEAGEPAWVLSLATDVTGEAANALTLQRSRDFTAFQARVNRALVQAEDDSALLTEIAQLAVRYAGAALAWFARPDDAGRFRVLASAGPATDYLKNIDVSTDASVVEGQGPTGRAWRTGEVLYNRPFVRNPGLRPWRQRARREGLQSSASLPIRRGGRVWAVFNVYLSEAVDFDSDLRAVLRESADDIARGLDALDERRMNFALTRHTDAGIAVVTHRRLDYVNPRFAELFGLPSPDVLLGHPTQTLYADADSYQRVGAAYETLHRQGVVRIENVLGRRSDGSVVLCDLIGTPLRGESTVWTWIDVSTRAQQQRQIARLSAFNALLAQVNHVVTQVQSEASLLQRICDLAVQHAGVSLAWIGRPDAAGHFRFLASAGPASDYLDGIVISDDPALPEGCGGAGQVWREGSACFMVHFSEDGHALPWAERAQRFGLKTGAVLPVRRHGTLWAVLSLYANEDDVFDERLRAVVQELARHISAGLDFLDLAQRERRTSALNARLLDALSVGVVVARYPERVFDHANAQLLEMAGAATVEELGRHRAGEFYADDEEYRRVGTLAERVLAEGKAALKDVRYRHLDGHILWVDLSGYRLEQEDGGQRIIWTLVDATERHHNETEIKALSALRETLLDNTVVGIDLVRYPERLVIEANRGFLDMMGYGDEPGAIIGHPTSQIYALHSEDRRMAELSRQILEAGGGSLSDLQVRRRDGRLIYLDMHGRRLETADPQQPVIVWTSVDVTERHGLAEELNRQALFDALTGLPNRRALDQHVTLAIARARRHATGIAVGMIDLDDFKPVNDRFGHAAGDTLLTQFATRMRATLRDSDFVARLGGDEFVAVMEDIDRSLSGDHLAAAWTHLHSVVEAPFKLGREREARVDMSMGVALYPADGEDADALLRRADAAMYRAKAHKLDREHWWQMDKALQPAVAPADPFEPFGTTALSLLDNIRPHLDDIGNEFAAAFYDDLVAHPESAAILSRLSAVEFASLKSRQARHLKFLLAPESSETAIATRGRELGRIHALAGVTPDWIPRGVALYGRLLRTGLERLPSTARSRYRAVRAADARLWLDLQTQLSAMQAVMDAYHAHTARKLPPPGSWASLVHGELSALASLPGVRACQLMRPHGDGIFAIERSAGPIAEQLIAAVRDRELAPRLDASAAVGQGLINAAWRTGEIQRTDAYGQDPRTRAWHDLFAELGVRSLLVLPVRNVPGPEFVLVIEGAYPNQFAAGWMRSFADSLVQRWRQLASHADQRVLPVRQEQADTYRRLLYAGALEMFVQPVVRLDSGAPVRGEALARLVTPDGEVLEPRQFLTALRDDDFHFLFRSGLDQSLRYLREWLGQGLDWGVALNVAPSTLIHPSSAWWVERALRQQQVAPSQLTLELLENQEFDEEDHDASIAALRRLGVQLAIDDLGRGYSSLSRLSRLPFDVIKIDQTLVADVGIDPIKTLSLLRTLVLIGRDLEREVVVEGVGTQGLMEAARILGARFAQGYAIAGPMRAQRLLSWQQEWRQAWRGEGDLKTYLGALAYHWRALHDPEPESPSCALTAFFAERDLADSEVASWHQQVHQAGDARQRRVAHDRVTRWLARQVRRQADRESTA